MKPKQINIDGVLYDLMVVPLPHPARTPLFTTTDGKPVYEGDEYWFVWRTKYGNNLYDYAKNKAVKDSDSGASKDDKYFSTQAAAEQWIADNKPLYSLNDIQKALHGEWGTQNAVDNVLNRIKNSKK